MPEKPMLVIKVWGRGLEGARQRITSLILGVKSLGFANEDDFILIFSQEESMSSRALVEIAHSIPDSDDFRAVCTAVSWSLKEVRSNLHLTLAVLPSPVSAG